MIKMIKTINGTIKNKISKKYIVIYSLIISGLLLLPLFLTPFTIRMLIMAGIYMVLAMSLNLITGITGQLSLGHAAFYGIGAYTSALLSIRLGFGFLITALLGGIFTAIIASILGAATLKLQGAYLAIVTLGFSEIVRIILLNWMSLTRGPMGITGIPRPKILNYQINSSSDYYYLILIIVVVTYISMNRIIDSRLGRAFRAIKEDDLAAQSMGINVLRYKIMAFTISAFYAGIAGSFYAHYVTYIDPQSFTFGESIQILSMVVLGGLGSMQGVMLGASILVFAPELMRSLAQYRMIIYGGILSIMMIVRPEGILGSRKGKKREVDTVVTEGA
ncbi:amino acid/amide ABC transporter membrane protein 2 (HAAT family) [Serpentinicella alkaliphila]|uniref:Amino acid/amide ABC transporter membrane protein 2 (HAAT family) n=2 Tax=Serpentinicella alkaliphila TaxID=1734049 RepID=A0A4R2TTG0_9FIRM|nr:amino acid/amide ABC transporter membrane protein 2 (HAAT family) [Serpentinicella alkaliphila]